MMAVIDMMVDPDGTLDALSTLGITSPLADQKISPGARQRELALHPGAEALPSTQSASRPEGLSAEHHGSSDHVEVGERSPGPQQNSRSYN